MSALIFLSVGGGLLFALFATLFTEGECWTFFSRERRLKRRYARVVWARAAPLVEIGMPPDDAVYQAKRELAQEAIAVLNA